VLGKTKTKRTAIPATEQHVSRKNTGSAVKA